MQQQEKALCPELVAKAVAQLSQLFRAYVQEENAAYAEKIATQIGRAIIEWEYKSDFNTELMSVVAEQVQELVPEAEFDVEIAFEQMRKMFYNLLGYFVASKRHDVMHELMNDTVLNALEAEGFFEMLASEDALEFDEEDEEEEEDYEDDSCCDDEDDCCDDEDECCGQDDEDYA